MRPFRVRPARLSRSSRHHILPLRMREDLASENGEKRTDLSSIRTRVFYGALGQRLADAFFRAARQAHTRMHRR